MPTYPGATVGAVERDHAASSQGRSARHPDQPGLNVPTIHMQSGGAAITASTGLHRNQGGVRWYVKCLVSNRQVVKHGPITKQHNHPSKTGNTQLRPACPRIKLSLIHI